MDHAKNALFLAREWGGKSLRDLSEATGIAVAVLHANESAGINPAQLPHDRLERIAEACGLSVDQVIGRQALPDRRM